MQTVIKIIGAQTEGIERDGYYRIMSATSQNGFVIEYLYDMEKTWHRPSQSITVEKDFINKTGLWSNKHYILTIETTY